MDELVGSWALTVGVGDQGSAGEAGESAPDDFNPVGWAAGAEDVAASATRTAEGVEDVGIEMPATLGSDADLHTLWIRQRHSALEAGGLSEPSTGPAAGSPPVDHCAGAEPPVGLRLGTFLNRE